MLEHADMTWEMVLHMFSRIEDSLEYTKSFCKDQDRVKTCFSHVKYAQSTRKALWHVFKDALREIGTH